MFTLHLYCGLIRVVLFFVYDCNTLVILTPTNKSVTGFGKCQPKIIKDEASVQEESLVVDASIRS